MFDTVIDKFMLGILLLIMVACIVFFVCLGYWGLDYMFCGGDVANSIYEQPGIITDLSFKAAHQERHCSKGCYYIDVPDTWYAQVCSAEYSKHPDEDNWCRDFSFTHAPWDWQQKGASVTIISHQRNCDRGWYYYAFRKAEP